MSIEPATRIKVLQIVEATVGGARRHVTDLVCNLDRSRFAVSVVCSTLRDKGFLNDIEKMREKGAEVTVVRMVRRICPARDLLAFSRICNRIKRGGFDVVHTHSSKAGFLGRLAAGLNKVPLVVHTAHTFPFHMEVGRAKKHLYFSLEKLAARFTDRFICVCRQERDAVASAGLASPDKFVVIENGIAPSPRSDRMASRKKLGLNPGDLVIGAVGRFTRQKGYPCLVQAAGNVVKHFPAARFVLIGGGEMMSEIRQLIERLSLSRHFVLPGALEEGSSFHPAFDVFVLPSLWESLPYSLLEAMAAGNAIVAANVGGIPEAIADGKTGLLVPPGNAEPLAAAIMRLLGDPDLRGNAGLAARSVVESRYRLDRMVREVEALYMDRSLPK